MECPKAPRSVPGRNRLPRSGVLGYGTEAPMVGVQPSEITALLGRGTHFDGKLRFDGVVRIDGSFSGEIRSEDTLIVGEGAEIRANVTVATVIVRGGTVIGDIRAKVAVEVHAPAKVVGNIHSPSLFIDRGVAFEGTCRMDAVEPDEDIEVP